MNTNLRAPGVFRILLESGRCTWALPGLSRLAERHAASPSPGLRSFGERLDSDAWPVRYDLTLALLAFERTFVGRSAWMDHVRERAAIVAGGGRLDPEALSRDGSRAQALAMIGVRLSEDPQLGPPDPGRSAFLERHAPWARGNPHDAEAAAALGAATYQAHEGWAAYHAHRGLPSGAAQGAAGVLRLCAGPLEQVVEDALRLQREGVPARFVEAAARAAAAPRRLLVAGPPSRSTAVDRIAAALAAVGHDVETRVERFPSGDASVWLAASLVARAADVVLLVLDEDPGSLFVAMELGRLADSQPIDVVFAGHVESPRLRSRVSMGHVSMGPDPAAHELSALCAAVRELRR